MPKIILTREALYVGRGGIAHAHSVFLIVIALVVALMDDRHWVGVIPIGIILAVIAVSNLEAPFRDDARQRRVEIIESELTDAMANEATAHDIAERIERIAC